MYGGVCWQMLLCDGCDHGYHTYCMQPKIRHIPGHNCPLRYFRFLFFFFFSSITTTSSSSSPPPPRVCVWAVP